MGRHAHPGGLTRPTPGRAVEECGGCGSERLESVLTLGASPPACSMQHVSEPRGPEAFYPLELLRCADCTLVQLGYVVPATLVFAADYPYSSGNSPQLRAHFAELARTIRDHGVGSRELIVDIGANDGTLLRALDEAFAGAMRLAGVEPTNQGCEFAEDHGWYQAFFGRACAEYVRDIDGPAKIITACNVLAHAEDIHDTLDALTLLLDDHGTLIVENHDLASVVDGGQWDTVYHEHLRYFTPHSFARLAEEHGLYAWREHAIGTHGGSFRMYLRKDRSGAQAVQDRSYDFASLRKRAARNRAHLRSMISSVRVGGKRVVGIGATARASTVIGYAGLSEDDLDAVCEVKSSSKIGRRMPGTRIPVISEEALFEHGPEYAVLFSWHLAEVILGKLRAPRGYRGDVILPLPEVRLARG